MLAVLKRRHVSLTEPVPRVDVCRLPLDQSAIKLLEDPASNSTRTVNQILSGRFLKELRLKSAPHWLVLCISFPISCCYSIGKPTRWGSAL